MDGIKEKFTKLGVKKLLAYMDADYERNVPKALDLIEVLDRSGQNARAYASIRAVMNDPESNWRRFLKSIYEEYDKETRRTLLNNFVINASVTGTPKREEIAKREGCNIPWAILLDPTSACNLKCTGCWAAEYGSALSMDLMLLDRIITEAEELGIHMFIFSGGEPLVRKTDIIILCSKHSDSIFLAFTNGTLIDRQFAGDMKAVQNFIPAISVEGFREANDSRRGEGTYDKVLEAMRILRQERLPFGISTCYTSQNVEEVGSDAFIDAMIENGAKFCWYFTYMPIGSGAPTNLMASDSQRAFMYRQVRRFRSEKPMFIIDFWNDGEFVGGCIAGGRSYIHINANGDVEPCAFIHYANHNIRDMSLLEALKSPLFMEYRKGQPFNGNHLRPCPLLDNPGKLAEMVKKSGAHSTDMACPEDVDALSEKCRAAADRWAVASQRIWEESPAGIKCAGCGRCEPK